MNRVVSHFGSSFHQHAPFISHLLRYTAALLNPSKENAVSRRRSFEVPGLRHQNPIPMGCIIDPFMMSSGIFGMEPETRKTPDDVQGQCRLMFANIRRVMEAAGGS